MRPLHTPETPRTSTRPSPTTTTPAVARSSTPARRAARWIACAACVSLAACGSASSTAPGPVRFAEQVAPLAAKRCDGCHAGAPGGPMAVYGNARSFITPGKPDESLYYTLPKGHPAAWGDAADLVRAWIAAGAPE